MEEFDVDIDSLLNGPEEIPSSTVAIEESNSTEVEQTGDINKLYNQLEGWNRSCRDLFVDLRTVDFTVTEEDMILSFKDKNYFDKDIYFKIDPEHPKDPKTLQALKQFCKFLGIPQPFFSQNRPSLKMNIVKTWQTGLRADEKKGTCIARIRESKECCILRAMVPETYSTIQNHEIINTVRETLKVPFRLDYYEGDGRDSLILHTRFLFGDIFKILDLDVCLGFSITASELGASPLIVDAFLFDTLHKTTYIASYGTESFFKTKYEGLQPKDIKELLPKMVERIQLEAPEMKQTIEDFNKAIVPLDECLLVRGWRGLPGKFKKALYQEMAEKGEDVKTHWDFALKMGLIAKDFDTPNRVAIEKAAGRYLNLVFEKS